MRNKLDIIKVIVSVLVFVALVSFTYHRHKSKTINAVEINFLSSNENFIDTNAVNKLLIQNKKHVKNMLIDELDLNIIETRLESHPMVENAEVYLNLNNNLSVDISQPVPIGRVIGKEQFYIDINGNEMPLSKHYSARVPLVFNLRKDQIKEAHKLLKFIREDGFLTQRIIQIKAYSGKQFSVKMRDQDFEVFVGNTENLNQKFFNFKAFYVKAEQDTLFNKYKTVKLQYGNQVVCEKY